VAKYLQVNQIVLLLTDLKYPVMKLIKRSHLVELIGTDHFFHSVFHAHMHIYARLRLLKGKSISSDIPHDYLGKMGANLINFENVNLGALERQLTASEQAMIASWDPYEFNTSVHPLNKVKKGFELGRSIGRFSLASKPENISVKRNSENAMSGLPNEPNEVVRVA